MEDKQNIYQKLLTIQGKLKVPKNQFNKFGNYNYRNCEDIQEAVKPLLKEVKAVLVVGDGLIMIDNRIYIKATVRLIDCETGEAVENVAFAREEDAKKGMDASQVTGSTSSYARKYALNGLLCIDDNKDSDSFDNKNKDNDAHNAPSAKEAEQINAIYRDLARTGIGKKNLCKNYGVDSIESMSTQNRDDALKVLSQKPDKPIDPATIPPDDPECGLPFSTPVR